MSVTAPWKIVSFYRFLPLAGSELGAIRKRWKELLAENGILGLMLLAEEGVNATLAGSPKAIDAVMRTLCDEFSIPVERLKESFSLARPFKRLSVEVRAEIVTLKRPDLVPQDQDSSHLSPEEWHQLLLGEEEKIVIDTRNSFEIAAGRFPGAIDPGLTSFSEWGEYLDSALIPRDKTVMIYCTGGIRCEKAILEMRARGFEKVYQLQDGILGYFEKVPGGLFEGECFVFDDRVAVDQDLKPTQKFGICPGCGLTGSIPKTCERCQVGYFVCDSCKSTWGTLCSKACKSQVKKSHVAAPTES